MLDKPRPILDGARLQRSGFGNGVMLVISSWVGILVGITFSLGSGLVPGIFGFVLVPMWGFFFGKVGLSKARDNVIRQTDTEILPKDHPLTRAVHGMAAAIGLPSMPLVGIYPDEDINAFAAGSGPYKAVVSFSQGCVDRCTRRELLAITAHELAHIANNDMRRMQFAWSFQNALTWYMMFERARAFIRWILGTIGEMMILKLSRNREYWADATAAALLGPEPMIEALKRLRGDPVEPRAKRLAYAKLMIRSNPHEWFSTHPTLDKRIAALQSGEYVKRLPYKRAA
jgi:heat shock protein HtpX